MKKNIPYGRQSISKEDIEQVVKVLQSDFITQGPVVERFEKKLAEYVNAKYAVAVSSGTAALHLACLAIGVKSGDEVISTPITFSATTNSVIYCGGKPVFADINSDTFNINLSEIEKQIAKNSRIKGIIPVHFSGLPADMERIYEIAKENNIWIIEDACHALGGSWIDKNNKEYQIGSCSHSDMAVFSFHPVKQITTGEGGAVTTNNYELYKKLKILKRHGITKDPELMWENHGGWYYEMHELGFNYRITDIQAALGICQLKKIDSWVEKRLDIVYKYDEEFKVVKQIRSQIHPANKGKISYHLYVIQAQNRKELYDFLREKGIYTQVHYIPVHLQPYYKRKFGFKKGDYPIAEEYYSNALSLPLYPDLSKQDQQKVIDAIKEFYHVG